MQLPTVLKMTTLRSKLLFAFLAVGLIPFVIITIVALNQAGKALSNQAFGQLLSLRDAKQSQVEAYLQTMKDQIITFSEDHMIVDAMAHFKRDAAAFMKENDITSNKIGGMRNNLGTYYSGDFSTEYRRRNDNRSPDVNHLVNQLDPQAIAFQYHYIKANPHPLGSKENMDRAQDDSQYSRSHAYYHPIIRSYLRRFGYYDIFLVHPESGRIVYSVFKELDYMTSLVNGPYAQTNFGEVFRQANASTIADSVAITDYKQYFPSYEDPAGFIASPIFKDGRKIGVLIFQFPIDRLNTIMTARAGLGETGETYLVGSDLLMRSDSFLDPENHSVVNSFKHPEKGQVDTEASRGALAGEDGERIIIDYNGNPVLSAFAPLQFGDLHWAMIAEIDEAEAFIAVTTLKWITGVVAAICVLAIAGLALLITRGIVKPVTNIAQAMNTIATENDLTVEVPVETQDEVGTMAGEFNTMMAKLRQTLKSVLDASKEVQLHSNDVAKRASANRKRALNQEKQMTVMQKTVQEMGSTAGEVAQASNAQKESADTSMSNIRELVTSMESVSDASLSQQEEAQTATDRVGVMGETGAKVVATAQQQGEQVVTATTSVQNMQKAVNELKKAAEEATKSGKEALRAVDEGRSSVEATVDGMRSISESSEQISEIITVITEIAEQTNLLSLNAAIEAARAGAHGKGFAVVADEVGKLAQRSSEAAKEITQLIKDSSTRVQEGSKLSDRSRVSLEKITESGELNIAAINEIAKASENLETDALMVTKMMEDLNELAGGIEQMAGQQGQNRESAQKALAGLVAKADSITSLVTDARKSATGMNQLMQGVVQRTDEMSNMTGQQAGRAKKLMEIATLSTEASKQTVEGAGTVVEITSDLQNLAKNLADQVAQFKV
jgi:methyl-accepting chemotaxis protein